MNQTAKRTKRPSAAVPGRKWFLGLCGVLAAAVVLLFLGRHSPRRAYAPTGTTLRSPVRPQEEQEQDPRQDLGRAPEEDPSVPAEHDADLTGVVVDDAGRPIAGAEIRCGSQSTWNWFGSQPEVTRVGRTDPAGQFAVALERGDVVRIEVDAVGFGPVQFRDCCAGAHLNVVLTRGVTVAVTVCDQRQSPVVGASVLLSTGQLLVDLPGQGGTPRLGGVTDDMGQCVLAGIRGRGEITLYVNHDKYAPGSGAIDIGSATSYQAVITLHEGQAIHGTVLDAATNAPIPGARVGFGASMYNYSMTDAGGAFTIHGWNVSHAEGQFVHASAIGYAPVRQRASTSGLTLYLHKGFSVIGRTTDQRGKALDGVRVYAVGLGARVPGLDRDFHATEVTSSADGAFCVRCLCSELLYELRLGKAGYGALALPIAPSADNEEVNVGDIALVDGLRLEGVVAHSDGTAAAEVPVAVRADVESRDREAYEGGQSCFTTDRGRFAFRDLAPGVYRLRFGGDPDSPEMIVSLHSDRYDLRMTLSWDEEFRVRLVGPSRLLRGGVEVDVGTPEGVLRGWPQRPGLAVFHVKRDFFAEYVAAQVTDETGATINAMRDDIPRDARVVELSIDATVVVVGHVTGPDGPVAHARVMVLCDGRPIGRGLADAAGHFEMKVPRTSAGRWDLRFDGYVVDHGVERWVPLAGEVRAVTLGTEAILECRPIDVDGAISVRIVDEANRGVPGVPVTTRPPRNRTLLTDASGVAEFSGLPAVPVTIIVGSRGAEAELVPPDPCVVVPNGQELVLAVRRAALVSGLVVWADGRRADGASVALSNAAGVLIARATTGRDGSFAMRVGREEPASISAEAQMGRGVYRADVAIRGVASGLTLELREEER